QNAQKHSYFDDLHALTKAGVFGYCDRLADFIADRQNLSDDTQVSLSIDEFNVVKLLLLKSADLGVLNNIPYQYLKKN
ncbi:ABC transporter substrate-binding protein, partial [Pseudoalteromonas sp. S1691]